MVESLKVINDCHIHLGRCSGINKELYHKDVVIHKDFYNLHKILVMAGDVNPSHSNDEISLLTHTDENIYGLYWLDDPYNSNVRLTNKMIGVKYHGAYTGYPIDPDMEFLEDLNKSNAILLVHCGRYKEGSRESNTSFYHALDVADTYTHIKVILAHMGGTDTTICKKAMREGSKHENVYFDTSGITTPYIIEYAIEYIPSTRILFGSDVPWCSFNSQYYNVMDAQISDEDRYNIMHHSFMGLLK